MTVKIWRKDHGIIEQTYYKESKKTAVIIHIGDSTIEANEVVWLLIKKDWLCECPVYWHKGKPFIRKAFTPKSVLNHSLAPPSSVARVMYQKYVNSIPLYRQEKD